MTTRTISPVHPLTAVPGDVVRAPGEGGVGGVRGGGWLARLAALLALALAYFVAGRLGLLLAIPPGFSSAVWPASGIALGALVVFGTRLWPGVLLGSFCVNASMSFDTGDASSIFRSTLVCAAIGLGAALQALAGRQLVRRCIDLPPLLNDARTIIWFLACAGPIACLTNATVGVGTLFAVGAIPSSNVLFNWCTWWAGDSIGVLIFAPLVLVAFGRPRAAWRPRAATVALPLGVAFTVVVVFFMLARASESTAIRERFRNDASNLTDALAADLVNDVEVLQGVERFYANSHEVEREGFRGFVARALERRPGLAALSWNAVVTEPERAAYVQRVRAEGFPGFEITERTGAGERVEAPVRAEHIVVTFIEPLVENRGAMGFDVASTADRREALERARDTGQPSATGPVRLVQGGADSEGMLVFMPVYRKAAPHGTPEERRAAIRGFVAGVVRFDALIEAALRRFDRSGLELRIRDTAAAAGDPPLYAERAGVRVGGVGGPGRLFAQDYTDLAIEQDVAGRRWVLSFARTQEYLAAHRPWHVWMVMAGGMAMAGTLGVFLLVLTGRTMRIAAMVDERTAELSRANAALVQSERRFELAVEGSSVGIWEWTIATGEEYLSPRWKAMLGYRDDELPNVVASWSDRLHPDDAEQTTAATRAHLERREPYDVEYRLRCKDGAYRWFHARGQAMWGPDGTPVKMAGSLENVDARRNAEDLARRISIDLEESNARIVRQNNDLAALAERAHRVVDDVSHEFRTPLSVIKEFASIIGDGLAGPVSTEQADYLRIVDGAVIDLNHMVEDLLDSSKLRAGRLRVDRRAHRVEDLFAAGRAGLARQASLRSIAVQERIEPGLPEVFADQEKACRIIGNLTTNAIKFSPERGTIVLSAARSALPGEVVISVSDHGPGLSVADIDRLFGRFEQTSASRTVAAKGFGLGLNIARELAGLNLGGLSVVSEKGRGATFSFTMPEHDPSAVLAHYFQASRVSDMPGDELALLRVEAAPMDGPHDPEEPSIFLASITHPTDVIVPSPWAALGRVGAAPPRAWWIVGRSRSPSGWVGRLRAAREQMVSESSFKVAPLTLDVYGAWSFPAEADRAFEAVRHALGVEPVHAQ